MRGPTLHGMNQRLLGSSICGVDDFRSRRHVPTAVFCEKRPSNLFKLAFLTVLPKVKPGRFGGNRCGGLDGLAVRGPIQGRGHRVVDFVMTDSWGWKASRFESHEAGPREMSD